MTGSLTASALQPSLAGRYVLERELGRGGMATVFLAHDLKHDRDVAIKVLDPDLARSIANERFLREIGIAARLNHPHVLPLLDSGVAGADELPFYVMPLVDGESLRERLHRDGRLSLEESLRLAAEVTDALAYAHEHQVVHRDVKPDNVMLSGGHAVVMDFGIAKSDGAEAKGLTGANPVSSTALMHLHFGHAYAALGSGEKSASHFEEAARIDPNGLAGRAAMGVSTRA